MLRLLSLKHVFSIAFIFFAIFLSAINPDPSEYKIIIFEGSDWCVRCIKLEEEVLADSTFINFIKSNEIELERIDFPQRKKLDKAVIKYNESVAERFKFEGTFPTLLLIDKTSETVYKIDSANLKSTDLVAMIRTKIATTK